MAGSIISEKGLVVIPKEIRKKYGLKKGDRVQFIDWGGQIVVLPVHADPIRASRGILPRKGSMADFLEEKQRELEEEEKDLPPPRLPNS
ncbi:MAG: AbrB/MazE/SpoVT family DNA-binding domain-containing protein [Chloroflexi bacterium]|nr:MAG: AbrB/MazE/SpoVT family DNA-binding domain-containing protein [Chloroflexota bacterium]